MKKYYIAIICIVLIVAIVGIVNGSVGTKKSNSGLLVGEATGSKLKCKDFDGKNIFVRGVTRGPEFGTGKFVVKRDYCITEGEKAGRLAEFYCLNNQVASETFGTEDGCSKCVRGRCVKQ